MSDISQSPTRARCPHCLRALRSCLCALARPVQHQVQLLILMHPDEVHEAKGTGHLLHLCLPHSQTLVGEQLDDAALQQALHGAWPGDTNTNTAATPRHTLLLYPATTAQDTALGLEEAAPLPQPWPCPPQRLRLVVLDGTWRKSRKMLYCNPALQTLPRLALQNVPPSQYAIRKAHLPGQLSTFEATVLALAQLEQWPADSPQPQSLQQVFERFVAMQIQMRQQHSPR